MQETICEKKYFIPYCREKGCKGILKIKFNEYDFSIDFKCTKNEKHEGNNIFFKTFERFYLKEIKIINCSQCSNNIENDIIYKCKECEKAYCFKCFHLDKHIKKNINNLTSISKKCELHNRELNHYCFDCRKNICIFCKNNTEEHKEHKTKIIDIMLTNKQINDLKNKIKKKSEYISDLIKSINNWEKTLNNKIKNLKDNLQNEMILIEKMFLNYNQYSFDYYYLSNFLNFYNYLKVMNNDYLKQFKESHTFEKQTKILIDYILPKKDNEIKNKNGIFEKISDFDGIISKINEKYFFTYSFSTEKAEINRYNKDENMLYYLSKTSISFQQKIYSITCSDKNNKIYACLKNRKIVVIFEFNLTKKTMKLCNEQIKSDNDLIDLLSHFEKCIS